MLKASVTNFAEIKNAEHLWFSWSHPVRLFTQNAGSDRMCKVAYVRATRNVPLSPTEFMETTRFRMWILLAFHNLSSWLLQLGLFLGGGVL